MTAVEAGDDGAKGNPFNEPAEGAAPTMDGFVADFISMLMVERGRREASAPSFSNIFTLDSPRAQEDWPEITPRPVPEMHESITPLDAPLACSASRSSSPSSRWPKARV